MNFNFAIHQSKTSVVILVNTFYVSSLILLKKQWSFGIIYWQHNRRLWKTYLVKTLTTNFLWQSRPLPFFLELSQKNWTLLKTRKPRIFFVVLWSIPYHVWHLNNVRVWLFQLVCCSHTDHRSVNFWKDVSFI